jgi:uncharacterized protein (DUF4415 family)
MKKKSTLKGPGTDFERLTTMTEDEIDVTEIPEISPEQFARALVRRGLKPVPPKAQLTIRVDRDVLEWFRRQGRGYQTRIGAVLRAYMEAHKKGGLSR